MGFLDNDTVNNNLDTEIKELFTPNGMSNSIDSLDHIELSDPAATVGFLTNKAEEYSNTGLDLLVNYVPRIFFVAFLLWIGFKLIKKGSYLFDGLLENIGLSKTIRPFLVSIIKGALKAGLLLVCAGIIGLELSIFASIIAASVFAIGLSLQGSLGNFASGILVLTLNPYEVGHWISIEDKFGRVVEIGIFSTIIVTPGKKTLIIPNSKITNDTVTNYSLNDVIRLELEVNMPYNESFPRVKEIIIKALDSVEHIVNRDELEIGIADFDSHNLSIAVRPYVHPDQYWKVTYDSYEAIKKAFSDNNIQVAYSEGVQMGNIGD